MVKYNEANTLSFQITNVSCWLVKDYDYVLVGTCEDEVKLIHMPAYTLCTRMHTITYYAHTTHIHAHTHVNTCSHATHNYLHTHAHTTHVHNKCTQSTTLFG